MMVTHRCDVIYNCYKFHNYQTNLEGDIELYLGRYLLLKMYMTKVLELKYFILSPFGS